MDSSGLYFVLFLIFMSLFLPILGYKSQRKWYWGLALPLAFILMIFLTKKCSFETKKYPTLIKEQCGTVSEYKVHKRGGNVGYETIGVVRDGAAIPRHFYINLLQQRLSKGEHICFKYEDTAPGRILKILP